MKTLLWPTPETYQAPVNGTMVPTRIWKGVTEGGSLIEAYVLAIVPQNTEDDLVFARLKNELPPFMRPAREVLNINVDAQPLSENMPPMTVTAPEHVAILSEEILRLREELRLIAVSDPQEWDPEVRDQFQQWAQNRAAAALR